MKKKFYNYLKLSKKGLSFIKLFILYFKLFIIILLIIINYLLFINNLFKNESLNNNFLNKKKVGKFEIGNLQPENYERDILNQIKNRLKGHILIPINELYFINGLIRKYKPIKLLEIGVCSGGVSATILNAIKDIDEAKLYSCDLEKKHYMYNNFQVGYVAKDNFPELMNKWKLYTGNTTAAFIEEIGGNIDFVFIDTAHVMPGEVLNIIEILPFLKSNAIIVFDDINHHTLFHTAKLNYFHSCNNLLFSVLRGKKIIFNQKNNDIFEFSKLGAIILDNDQEKYYFEYFYLLSNNWSYMPNNFEIVTIRKIVEKYYKPFFLSIFDKAVKMNYEKLKIQGLLKKDYILYTLINSKREKPSYE